MHMKIEKISDKKIKVTISLRDLEERNIEIESLNYNSPAAQELFWDMMEEADFQFGFNASDSQLCIEAIPNNDESFVITITKLENDDEFQSIKKFVKGSYRRSELRVKRKTNKICSTIMIYRFDDIEALNAATTRIKNIYSGDSTLYKFKNKYYIVLSRNALNISCNIDIFELILNEYGIKISDNSYYEGFLNEHAKVICAEDALNVILNFF